MNTTPHISNLRKRAKALSLIITKVSDRSPLDGLAEYVVHHADQDWMHQPILSVYGVAQHIRDCEAVRGL